MKTIILLISASLLAGCATSRPDGLGVTEGRLAPCPDAPRCVSSQAPIPDVAHYVPAYRYIKPPAETWAALEQAVRELPRTTIIESQSEYLHAEVQTALLGFVDDLEFYLDRTENEIDVRSSARVGYFDGDTNRNRVEAIRAQLQQAGVVR